MTKSFRVCPQGFCLQNPYNFLTFNLVIRYRLVNSMPGPHSLEASQFAKEPLSDTSGQSREPNNKQATRHPDEILQQRNFLNILKGTIEDRITRKIEQRQPDIKRTDFILLTDRA
jgi:hypothetical protein